MIYYPGKYESIYPSFSFSKSIPRFGIPRLQPEEECDVIRGRSRYSGEPPAPAGRGSTLTEGIKMLDS